MNVVSKAVPLAMLLVVSGSALASDAALLRCRGIADIAARVACYDAIPIGADGPPGAQASAPAPAPEENFGLEAVKQREAQPTAIRSTVAGDFSGWGPGSQIRLANGQVWRIVDGSEAVLAPMKDPQVSIERNLFGTLFLRVEGSNSSAKVRRVE